LKNLAFRWLADGEIEILGLFLFAMGSRPEISFTRFLDEGIRGFMTTVGDAWMEGRLQVGEEHMASQVVREVLIRLRRGWGRVATRSESAEDGPPVAIVGAMEGDQHDLGSLSIRVLLERRGWRVYYLGANVPVEDFAKIQRAQLADLVCISFSPPNVAPDVQRAVAVLAEFYRPQTAYRLALGGQLAGEGSVDLPEDGPFESVSLSHSAEEFSAWLLSEFGNEDPDSGRKAA
jgi:methylmalonyl-CoA mutase cobalamin-binding subunit